MSVTNVRPIILALFLVPRSPDPRYTRQGEEFNTEGFGPDDHRLAGRRQPETKKQIKKTRRNVGGTVCTFEFLSGCAVTNIFKFLSGIFLYNSVFTVACRGRALSMAAARSGLLFLALLSPCYSFLGFPRPLRFFGGQQPGSTNDVNILVSRRTSTYLRTATLPSCVPVIAGAEPLV